MPLPPGQNVPLSSQFQTNPSGVVWSNGALFDGYVWLGIVMPTTPVFAYPWLIATMRKQRLPLYMKVLIVNGAIDQTVQALYNASINPPGTQYVAYWFTSEGTLITPASGTAVPFTVSAPTTILVVPTLTLPTGASAPVPQT